MPDRFNIETDLLQLQLRFICYRSVMGRFKPFDRACADGLSVIQDQPYLE